MRKQFAFMAIMFFVLPLWGQSVSTSQVPVKKYVAFAPLGVDAGGLIHSVKVRLLNSSSRANSGFLSIEVSDDLASASVAGTGDDAYSVGSDKVYEKAFASGSKLTFGHLILRPSDGEPNGVASLETRDSGGKLDASYDIEFREPARHWTMAADVTGGRQTLLAILNTFDGVNPVTIKVTYMVSRSEAPRGRPSSFLSRREVLDSGQAIILVVNGELFPSLEDFTLGLIPQLIGVEGSHPVVVNAFRLAKGGIMTVVPVFAR